MDGYLLDMILLSKFCLGSILCMFWPIRMHFFDFYVRTQDSSKNSFSSQKGPKMGKKLVETSLTSTNNVVLILHMVQTTLKGQNQGFYSFSYFIPPCQLYSDFTLPKNVSCQLLTYNFRNQPGSLCFLTAYDLQFEGEIHWWADLNFLMDL